VLGREVVGDKGNSTEPASGMVFDGFMASTRAEEAEARGRMDRIRTLNSFGWNAVSAGT
jgi:hypothetical protein